MPDISRMEMPRQTRLGDDELVGAAVGLAHELLSRAEAGMRWGERQEAAQLARMLLAALAAGCAVECSLPPQSEVSAWLDGFVHRREDERALAARLGRADYGVVRAETADGALRLAAVESGVRLVCRVPVANGRVELLPYFREQALSKTRHRHGSVLPGSRNLP